jgi:hypothetical protein
MARIFGRVLVSVGVAALLLFVSHQTGAHGTHSAQLAYSYHDRRTREATTYLVDTHRRLQIRLRAARESVKLIGWLDSQQLLVELDHQLARFAIGSGWQRDTVCPPDTCTLAIISSSEPVGTWQGRTAQDLAPQWSPDGAQVALMRRVGNGFALLLYVTDMSGETRRITRRGVLGLNYFWRPCPEAGCSS